MPVFTLGQLAELLGCEIAGDPQIEISGVSTIDRATSADITFLANSKYTPKLKSTRAGAVIAAAPAKDSEALSNSSRKGLRYGESTLVDNMDFNIVALF